MVADATGLATSLAVEDSRLGETERVSLLLELGWIGWIIGVRLPTTTGESVPAGAGGLAVLKRPLQRPSGATTPLSDRHYEFEAHGQPRRRVHRRRLWRQRRQPEEKPANSQT